LIAFYCWLRGRFGKICVVISSDRLVARFELFGRQRSREFVLDATSRAGLVADFHMNTLDGVVARRSRPRRVRDDDRPTGQVRELPLPRRTRLARRADQPALGPDGFFEEMKTTVQTENGPLQIEFIARVRALLAANGEVDSKLRAEPSAHLPNDGDPV